MTTWRVVADDPRPGAYNMALDEALFALQAEGALPPTLRLYAWQPPCVSLGYFQRADSEVDLAACSAAGVDVVRRPTGGRAVLHEDELTYSVVIRQGFLPGSVIETYGRLSQGILLGLQSLGIEGELARMARRPAGRREPSADGTAGSGSIEGDGGAPGDGARAACFDAPSWYETLVGGRKIVGSAQTRASGVILQHGSLLVGFDAVRLASLLRVRSEAVRNRLAEQLRRRVTSVSEQLGRRPEPLELERALVAGMAVAMEADIVWGAYTEQELELAEQLYQSKYSTVQWTLRR